MKLFLKTRGFVFFLAVAFIVPAGLQGASSAPGKSIVGGSARALGISDGRGKLVLRLALDGRAVISGLVVNGREIAMGPAGVHGEIRTSSGSMTTSSGLADPVLRRTGGAITVTGIAYGASPLPIEETWTFRPGRDEIRWRIERRYGAAGEAEEAPLPAWDFASMEDWTSGLLGTGGAAWFQLFDRAGATYGVHTDLVTLWNRAGAACLRVRAVPEGGRAAAVRFTRRPDGGLTVAWSITNGELLPRYDAGTRRRRYLPDRDDVWSPGSVRKGVVAVEYILSAVDPEKEYGRGTLPGLPETSIRALANTAARLGVIDRRIHGSNSWRTPYGPAVLHEPFIAALGLLIDDEAYWTAYAETLDFQRDHAIGPDGRVKSRWAYTCEDAEPGTCDDLGFYEAQWGRLFDSNPDYVINVAELYEVLGDARWLRGHKASCERALDYLLRRDSDSDGLVEMMTAGHEEARGSDWLDVIWASWENAFVNAQLFRALTLWSGLEDGLGDAGRAAAYRAAAARLKARFNADVAAGGLWNPERGWYVHWRDRDDSVHGDNLVVFVNFMAVAYGLAEDAGREKAILERIETEMRREGLFFWPACLFPYAAGEAHASQYPFPTYENGDIFLAVGEVGVRAYARTDPGIAVAYIRRLLERYEKDGLAFQRYFRRTQQGTGDDILANNALAVAALYRDIYGVKPRPDRLFIDPRLPPELAGARLKYKLRGRRYEIALDPDRFAVSLGKLSVSAAKPFATAPADGGLAFFAGETSEAGFLVRPERDGPVSIDVEAWPVSGEGRRAWRLTAERGGKVGFEIRGLRPGEKYRLQAEGKVRTLRADAAGRASFVCSPVAAGPGVYEIFKEVPR